jgi:hypothetical protein
VAYALNEAEKRNLDYVIGSSGRTLRLYTTRPDAGFGSRGKTDTYVEVNADLLGDAQAGYLWLLFSASALRADGSLAEIMDRSKDYAADLGERLRERIYDEVVPELAEAIAEARKLEEPTREELSETYEMTLVLLYRLLFIAYAEDEDFLPRRQNDRYEQASLKQKAHDLHEVIESNGVFDDGFSDHWEDVMHLTRAIHRGHTEFGLPAYDGRLLSDDASISQTGAQLADIELSNAAFGPVLAKLLIDETEEGVRGPVDFRNIGVREFGVIYEGLLESELSVADEPLCLIVQDGEERYAPVRSQDEDVAVVVDTDEVYLHGQAGERKATGTYYTKRPFVEHLLDHALEPALDEHLERIERLRTEEGEQAAARAFFDLRVADIAMGSGHFLVGAVDRIESRLYTYLTEQPLEPVEMELDGLKDAVSKAFKNESYVPQVERGQLLRRQVARRCIYGIDLNPLATELARLSIWVHTFVPGLPLTFLEYNLRAGDSIIGIGSIQEVQDILGANREGNFSLSSFAGQDVVDGIREDIEALGKFSDASAEQVAEVRRTRAEIDDKLAEARARLDIIAASRLDDDIRAEAASDVDIDPTALPEHELANELLAPFDTLHFPTSFPEVFMTGDGFDVILGNPPWDKVRFEPQQFWVTRHPGLNTVPASRRDDEIKALRQRYTQQARDEVREQHQREEYQRYIKASFVDQGRGHYDFAKLFVERAMDVLADDGELGFVLPRQSLVLGGWKQLRKRLLSDRSVTVLQARNRGGWIFENLMNKYMIVCLSSRPTEDGEAYIWPAIEDEQAIGNLDLHQAIHYTEAELAGLTTTDRLVIPWFNQSGARELFPKMQDHPRLTDDEGWIWGKSNSSRWDFSGSGKHYELVHEEPEPGRWRVLMSRHVDKFGINTNKSFRRFVEPGNLVSEQDVEKGNGKIEYALNHPNIVYRYVARNDDPRTIIASALPESGYLYSTGYVHGIEHNEQTDRNDSLALLGYLNSFTCDWWARRIVDRHVTAPVINNLPIPDWDSDQLEHVADIAAELTRRGGIETLPGGHQIESSDELVRESQSELIADIEVSVADGFDLSRTDLEVVLGDFSEKACPAELRGEIFARVGG